MRKLLALLLTCMMVLALGGCGKREVAELDKFEKNGVFVYPGLEWGMTPEEAAEATGWPLDKASYNSDKDDIYELHNIPYGGEEWVVQIQFMHDGGLWCVSLLQEGKVKETEKLFDSMDAVFVEMLGEPDPGNYRMIKEVDEDRIDAVFVEMLGEPDSGNYRMIKELDEDRRMIVSEANWESVSEEDNSRLMLHCSYQEGRDRASLGLIVMCHPGEI